MDTTWAYLQNNFVAQAELPEIRDGRFVNIALNAACPVHSNVEDERVDDIRITVEHAFVGSRFDHEDETWEVGGIFLQGLRYGANVFCLSKPPVLWPEDSIHEQKWVTILMSIIESDRNPFVPESFAGKNKIKCRCPYAQICECGASLGFTDGFNYSCWLRGGAEPPWIRQRQ